MSRSPDAGGATVGCGPPHRRLEGIVVPALRSDRSSGAVPCPGRLGRSCVESGR
ncbi:MAG: hypothetical protein AVDCRST_MAG07-864 [uncultured Frankineae bacterium]|uniref:Uncharacterized protein n=1 Tax=uncultured Frankineae bacterium TaxID=437475 RepID=A0A6J4L0Q9_9ACTN|nr:MAG: hypothetical protein AVDCRST_MAG07-864 [uncultured Frankineae bacterium]